MAFFNRIIHRLKYEFEKLLFNFSEKRKLLIKFDENLFKGKRVALIGGADSVLKEANGKFLDEFDVVVRTNKGVEVIEYQYEYVGERTDVLFHFFKEGSQKGDSPITPELWEEKNVKNLFFGLNIFSSSAAFYLIKNFIKKTQGKIKFYQLPQKLYKINKDILRPYPPTIGFVAINTILACKPKELYITGVTFFKTPHNNAYRKGDLKSYLNQFGRDKIHNADIEYSYVKDLYMLYPNIITPDNTLREIFETN